MIFDYLADINWLAVLVAAVIYFALGAVWYSNALFGKGYRAALGVSEDAQGSPLGSALAINFVAWLVAAIGLALVIAATGTATLTDGLILGLVVGVGFVFTHMAVTLTYESRGYALLWISGLYYVIGFAVMGAILAIWD